MKAVTAEEEFSTSYSFLNTLKPYGLVVDTTIGGAPLEISADWSARHFADYVVQNLFPDVYQYLQTCGKVKPHPYVQRDEFIPVIMRYSKVVLFDPPKPLTGRRVFETMLVKTNRKSSRIAFGVLHL